MDDRTLGLNMSWRSDGGGRRAKGGTTSSVFRLPSSVFAGLFILLAVLFSCAGQKPAQTREETSKAVAQAVPAESESERKPPRSLPVNRPFQVTFEADPVLYAALSGDGKTLVYVSEKQGTSSLWFRPLDPDITALPEKNLGDLGRISAPALSHDAGKMAFVATGHDAKGDIYMLSGQPGNSTPRRLTGRDSADGAPALSPDGNRIYFHQLSAGEVLPRLATMDLTAHGAKQEIPPVEILREGSFPSISPNGQSMAFVSFKEDSGGDIWVLDLKTGKVKSITDGPAHDVYPAWSADGKSINFSRFNTDTNGDGIITFDDNAVISRVATEDADLKIYPLTSGTFSAYQPMPTSSEIFFLSNINGTGNIWKLPPGGQIPAKENVQAQMALARLLASHVPQK